MDSRNPSFLLIAGISLIIAPPSCTYKRTPDRPAHWAQPVEVAGVPNLHKVSDRLYRSAQPTEEGIRNLEELGITTVVNLRHFSRLIEVDEIESVRIPMLPWAPTKENAQAFLQQLSSVDEKSVLVHCMKGADRTGAMCALYRVEFEGWEPAEAIREMRHGGFGAHSIWFNLAPWVRKTTKSERAEL